MQRSVASQLVRHKIVTQYRVGASTSRAFSTSLKRDVDFTHAVIGGGAVGLAIARELASREGTSTLLIERHGSVGTETSSRNSEVIHAGLYYGPDTLKTELCMKGKHMLYDLCRKHSIPHRNTKKWVVAQDEQQMAALGKIDSFASTIDVPTRFLPRKEIEEREPDIRAEAGVLESESTGIVDSHALMAYLEGDFVERLNGWLADLYASNLEHWRLSRRRDIIETSTLINSAGLGAIPINNLIFPAGDARNRKPYYAKGSYFSYAASHPKPSTLIYPAPVPGLGGLGTHLTLDMAGRIRFGPDVEWTDDPTDLAPNASRLGDAIKAIKEYLPGIDEDAVDLDYCGVRPKLSGKGEPAADFYIKEEEGYSGFVNLLGIESPGLTSALAIGEMVGRLLYGSERGGGGGKAGTEDSDSDDPKRWFMGLK
ncbi:L-2-hydroxyglutarate dehydrogenase, mitochondrial [Cyphellophora attinorum]|uniref:L-2-hydroxyglutarate dehydrogenase, mitochondrial n=1 Tax=Cyphellophora attinorum TaxID=1664694 RepID=A0A0N1H1W9_9EURO|nr:L-2-hydroxyglutarate dehydrogenase, mitochondrial [Phialophora attinorum]KPI34995.1 L-2-hydroxyglutarate dehydrogenase, mitochondrial [Phialophora attinorum]